MPQSDGAEGQAEMSSFFEKALPIVLNALGSVAMLMTIGMLAIMVGAIGAFFGYAFASEHHLHDSLRYGVIVLGALLAPAWVGVWLWLRYINLDDRPPRSS